jgi:hypothetical protein
VRLDGDEIPADADDGDAGHATRRYIYLFQDSDARSEKDVAVRGEGTHPIPTWGRLEWDDDLPIEREVGGRIDTFCEQDWCAQPTHRRHYDRDVLERTLRLTTYAVVPATTTVPADGRVVAFVCPIGAANGDRIPGVQLRRLLRNTEKDPRGDACGMRR